MISFKSVAFSSTSLLYLNVLPLVVISQDHGNALNRKENSVPNLSMPQTSCSWLPTHTQYKLVALQQISCLNPVYTDLNGSLGFNVEELRHCRGSNKQYC